ncbi:hypothetical protein [Formosa sp. A9]|uniref:hypothetical protein n=1 Tax=Formosa sp. A9 TaxID=3442641 RepID=UPI003EBB3FB9
MKKSYSKSQLQDKAKAVFKDYPTATSVFATTDSQFFLNQNRAELHAGKKGAVIEIENEFEAPEKTDSKSKTAKELIAEAKTIETIEAVEAAIVLETEGDNRTTVLAAYNARIEELKADN